MKERNIAVAIILSIVTCGIYSIYWFIVLTDDIVAASDDSFNSGAMCFLLTLVTCGIYGYFWAYKMGQLLQGAKQKRGLPANSDMSIAYLLLQIFGLNIVNLALMQNDVNQFEY